MADLPPNIGFEDEPVVLLKYTVLDDSFMDSKKLLSKARNRIKSDSSITSSNTTSGIRKRIVKSSVSSLSDGSSFDMNDSEKQPLYKDNNDQQLTVKLSLKSLEEEKGVGGGGGGGGGGKGNKYHDERGPYSCSQESSDPSCSSSLSSPVKRENSQRNKHKKSFSVDVEPPNQVINLERELAARENEIANLRKQLSQNTTNSNNSQPLPQISILGPQQRDTESSELESSLGREQKEIELMGSEHRETNSEPIFNSQRTTLHRLLEEQQISSRLKSANADLRIKVVTLEREVDRLHQQNLIQLQQLEQATTSLAAVNSAHSSAAASKPKKKSSFFGLRRSGRKGSMGMSGKNGSRSSIEQSPQLQRPAHHSSSHLSLEGSFSEHDISSLLTRKSEHRLESPQASVTVDGEILQSKLRLSMEENAELERQLDSLRDELKHQDERIEEITRNTVNKNEFLSVVVRLEETQQALQLLTREKELVESEIEGLHYELETLRSERDNLISSLKGKEVKAVLKEKQEMDFLRSENKALMSEVRTLINNSDGLETSLSQLKREMVARDVRGHELKLKIKKLDSENNNLKLEIKSLKDELASQLQQKATHAQKENQSNEIKKDKKVYDISEKHSLTSTTPTSKLAIIKPVQQLSANNKKPMSFHERAQSEDLTINPTAPPLQMVRTSSGGTKFVAVQVTLPTLENPQVLDKSLSVPSLVKQDGFEGKARRKNSDSTLGTFVNSYSPSSPKPAVNSLVKMFETGKKGGGGGGVNGIKEKNEEIHVEEDNEGITFSVNSLSLSGNSSECHEDVNKPIVKSVALPTTKPPLAKSVKTRRHSSSSSLKEEHERKKSDEEAKMRRREEEAKKKEEMKERQRKEHEAKERQRREEKLKKEQEKQRKELEVKEKRERLRKEQEARERERREQEAKERERREQEAREREKREQEARERERREQEAKERERKEKEAREKCEQEAKEKREKELERQRKEQEERNRREQEKKEQEIKEKERLKKLQEEEERRKREELTVDRSQTWPPKAETTQHITTNTLPTTTSNKENDAVKTTPLGITKPKPPPTYGKARIAQSPPIQSDSSLTGVVANLRSSWEKKSQNSTPPSSHPPLSKTTSVPYRMGSFATPQTPPIQLQATVRPLTKSGSGPPATILSSPSDQKNQKPLSITRVSHMTPSQLQRVDSEPVIQQTTPTTHNGHVNYKKPMFPKASLERTSSADKTTVLGDVILRGTPPTNGHASPRLSTRPASLYVTSNSSPSPTSPMSFGTPTSEKRLSSLISKLQVMESTSSSSANMQQQTQSPILPRYGTTSTTTNTTTNTSTNTSFKRDAGLTRPQSFHSSPKPLQRAVSLASPLDRRSKKTMLLRWCQLMTQQYDNIAITNFGESFSNGLAFCALLHHFLPDRIPYHTLDHIDQKRNFELAFTVAESVGIPSLLDIDDMVEMPIPDWMSVMTYVSYIYNHFSKIKD